MPTLLVILDGLADEPQAGLGGRTPLEAAHTPNLDRLAAVGVCGLVDPTPPGQSPGSEAGIPSLLGVTAAPYGRAEVEALGRGIPVSAGKAACRVTCVRLSGPMDDPATVMTSIPDGRQTYEAVSALADPLAKFGVRLYPDRGGRHIAVLPGSSTHETLSPYDMVGLPLGVAGVLPRPGLWKRAQNGLGDGLALWPWGGGPPLCPRGQSPFGALVTGVDLVRGIGTSLGMEVPRVAGATGDVDADFAAKARAAAALLNTHRAVVLHLDAPDMAAHRRDPEAKRAVLERIDREVFGTLPQAPLRVVVACDHGTSSASGRHLEGPVPFLAAAWDETGLRRAPFHERALAGGREWSLKEFIHIIRLDRVTC